MPKVLPGDHKRTARLQVNMSDEVSAKLDKLVAETGLTRVIVGALALSVGVTAIEGALEAIKAGNVAAAVPGFQAEIARALAGFRDEVDEL